MSRAEGARREKAVDRKETPAPPAPGWLAWRRCRVSDAPAEELRWAHRWALVQLRNRSLDETTRRVAWARLILEEARGVSSAEPGPDPTVLDLALPHGLPARAAGDLETLRRAYRAEAMGRATYPRTEALQLLASLDLAAVADPEIEATAWEIVATALWAELRHRDARLALMAAAAALGPAPHHAERRVEILLRLGSVEMHLGHLGRGLQLLLRAEHAASGPGIPPRLDCAAIHQLALAELESYRPAAVLARYAAAEARFATAATPELRVKRLWVEAMALRLMGQLPLADERLEAAVLLALDEELGSLGTRIGMKHASLPGPIRGGLRLTRPAPVSYVARQIGARRDARAAAVRRLLAEVAVPPRPTSLAKRLAEEVGTDGPPRRRRRQGGGRPMLDQASLFPFDRI